MLVSTVQLGAAQVIPLLEILPTGEFNVGLRLASFELDPGVANADFTVNYLHWYPTTEESAERWKYRQYVTLFKTDEVEAIRNFKQVPLRYGASESMLNNILEGETYAILDAKVSPTSSNLIICFSGKGANTYTNALACETLASFGFEVLSIQLEANDLDPETNALLVDLAVSHFVADAAHAYEACGVVGHGDGATIALLYALKDRTLPVQAFAGLDPSFVGNAGLDEIKHLELPSMEKFTASMFLPVSGFWLETGERVSDFNNSVFEAAPPQLSHMVFMENLLHHSFVSDMHLRLDNSGVDFSDHGVDQDRAHVDRSYELLTELVIEFFDDTLNQDGSRFGDTLRNAAEEHPELIYMLEKSD